MKINGEYCKEIIVKTLEGEAVAVISDDDLIIEKGYVLEITRAKTTEEEETE